MFQLAVLSACQIPDRSGLPSAVRGSGAADWAMADAEASDTSIADAAAQPRKPGLMSLLRLVAAVTRLTLPLQNRQRQTGSMVPFDP